MFQFKMQSTRHGCIGMVTLPVSFLGVPMEPQWVTFMVIKDLAEDVLLGISYLDNNGINIGIRTRELDLENGFRVPMKIDKQSILITPVIVPVENEVVREVELRRPLSIMVKPVSLRSSNNDLIHE